MNANYSLRQHTCTGNYYKHYSGVLYTDGVKALCEQFQCYWLLDLVVSYQPELKGDGFQVWRLKRFEDSSAPVTCADGNGRALRQQEIPYTDFMADDATVWVEEGVVLLPSEH